jgi:hypothetical protein
MVLISSKLIISRGTFSWIIGMNRAGSTLPFSGAHAAIELEKAVFRLIRRVRRRIERFRDATALPGGFKL